MTNPCRLWGLRGILVHWFLLLAFPPPTPGLFFLFPPSWICFPGSHSTHRCFPWPAHWEHFSNEPGKPAACGPATPPWPAAHWPSALGHPPAAPILVNVSFLDHPKLPREATCVRCSARLRVRRVALQASRGRLPGPAPWHGHHRAGLHTPGGRDAGLRVGTRPERLGSRGSVGRRWHNST